jgi:hypothetical protein
MRFWQTMELERELIERDLKRLNERLAELKEVNKGYQDN